MNVSPFFSIASLCGPLATKETSTSVFLRQAAIYPPIEPAPKIQTLVINY